MLIINKKDPDNKLIMHNVTPITEKILFVDFSPIIPKIKPINPTIMIKIGEQIVEKSTLNISAETGLIGSKKNNTAGIGIELTIPNTNEAIANLLRSGFGC